MKRLRIIIFLVSLISFFTIVHQALAVNASFAPYRPRCVGIYGTFNATNWKGGAVQIGCDGDKGELEPNPAKKCTGEVQTVSPGKSFRLTKCSCLNGDLGCLHIGKSLKLGPLQKNSRTNGFWGYPIEVVAAVNTIPAYKANSCSITDVSKVCGQNGNRIKGNFAISCVTKPTPTNTPTPTPSPTPTLTPRPTVCVTPAQVQNVKITCPNCNNAPVTPTPTSAPTPTPTPIACNGTTNPPQNCPTGYTCKLNSSAPGSGGICVIAGTCGSSCQTNANCASGFTCVQPPIPTCPPGQECTTHVQPKTCSNATCPVQGGSQ